MVTATGVMPPAARDGRAYEQERVMAGQATADILYLSPSEIESSGLRRTRLKNFFYCRGELIMSFI
jgi:hypothetical protein